MSNALVPLTALSDLDAPELRALAKLGEAGLPLAPLGVVPAEIEEAFYRLNNLPEQLSALFLHLDLRDPDEDDIEELAPRAAQLIRQSYLLDEMVDAFYEGLARFPGRLRLRRLNTAERTCEGQTALRGRPALLALKSVWASEWAFEPLMARLERTQSVALEAAPVLVAPEGANDGGDQAAKDAAVILGQAVRVEQHPDYGLTGVRFAAHGA